MHDELVNTLKRLLPPDTFTTQCLFQPIPTLFAQRSTQRGGNVLGLDRIKGNERAKENTPLWLIAGCTETPEQCEFMRRSPTERSSEIGSKSLAKPRKAK
jgi:hypothetical protein